jgi:hypothetical protein
MQTQKFKGDAVELQMEAAAAPAFDICSAALDDFYTLGYDSAPFLLMLYDQARAPYSDRVPRDSFVSFIKEALIRFPFTGTFETYIFIIRAIFGEDSGILFDVPAPGKMSMLVSANASIGFDFIGRELTDGVYQTFSLVNGDGDTLLFTGISGIDNEYELNLLLSELIPAGIYPEVSLAFFLLSEFLDHQPSGDYVVIDHLGNTIVFFETGA